MAVFDLTLCFIFLPYPAQSKEDTAFVSRGRNTVRSLLYSVTLRCQSLSPIVTFSAASLDVLDRFLVFSPVSADKPHGPGSGLEGPAAAGPHAAGHLVGLD